MLLIEWTLFRLHLVQFVCSFYNKSLNKNNEKKMDICLDSRFKYLRYVVYILDVLCAFLFIQREVFRHRFENFVFYLMHIKVNEYWRGCVIGCCSLVISFLSFVFPSFVFPSFVFPSFVFPSSVNFFYQALYLSRIHFTQNHEIQ